MVLVKDAGIEVERLKVAKAALDHTFPARHSPTMTAAFLESIACTSAMYELIERVRSASIKSRAASSVHCSTNPGVPVCFAWLPCVSRQHGQPILQQRPALSTLLSATRCSLGWRLPRCVFGSGYPGHRSRPSCTVPPVRAGRSSAEQITARTPVDLRVISTIEEKRRSQSWQATLACPGKIARSSLAFHS